MSSETLKTKLDWALHYNGLGFSVIPTGTDKKPLVEWGPYSVERSSRQQIENWWKQWPNANPAVITGAVSGIVVLDIDAKHGRRASEFQVPPTACSKTGRGGNHFFFKHPGRPVKTAAGVFGLGVDIRGDGGYALLPPSVNSERGTYEWITTIGDAGLAGMPPWMEGTSLVKKWEAGKDGVNVGRRNDTAASIAGKILRSCPKEFWESMGWPLLVEWNKKNTPPLDLKELRLTWQSIRGLHQNESRRESTPNDKNKKLEPSIDLETLLNTEFPEARFAVEQLIETGTINMLSAPPNKWKSWLLLVISICVASGKPLFEKFATIKQPVMIVNEEDRARLLQDRLRILLGDEKKLPIYFHIDKGVKLGVIGETNPVPQIVAEAKERKVGLIIFDSLRSVHDFEENSSKDMQLVMDVLKKITREDITVLFSHHNRKKIKFGGNKEDWDDARGSTAINAAVHGHLACDEMEREDGSKGLIVYQHKLKAAAKIAPFEVAIHISQEPDRINFQHCGEYKSKERALSQTRSAVFEVFEDSTVWLSISDLIEQRIAKETTIRAVVKALVREGLLQEKQLRQAQKLGLPIQSPDAKHNAKIYFRVDAQMDDDPEEDQAAQLPIASP